GSSSSTISRASIASASLRKRAGRSTTEPRQNDAPRTGADFLAAPGSFARMPGRMSMQVWIVLWSLLLPSPPTAASADEANGANVRYRGFEALLAKFDAGQGRAQP